MHIMLICAHIRIYARVYAHMGTYIHICMMCAYMHGYVHVCAHICIYMQIYVWRPGVHGLRTPCLMVWSFPAPAPPFLPHGMVWDSWGSDALKLKKK